MPYSLYEKLGLGEPKPTRMCIELADRSIQYPMGIAENVMITIDKFDIPINFVILDMPENSKTPIILGRPFLATAHALIDVFNKKITLKVGDEQIIFDIEKTMKKPQSDDDTSSGNDELSEVMACGIYDILENDHCDSFHKEGLNAKLMIFTQQYQLLLNQYGVSTKPIRRIRINSRTEQFVQPKSKSRSRKNLS